MVRQHVADASEDKGSHHTLPKDSGVKMGTVQPEAHTSKNPHNPSKLPATPEQEIPT